MVKKKFDKKNATTYSLVYQPTGSEVAGGLPGASDGQAPGEGDGAGAGAGAGGRMLHEFASHARSQQTLSEAELRKFRAKQGTPLDWLMEERGLKAENTLDERRRHELIELGFDDDGYDYLQHLKTLDDVRDGGREGDQGGEGDGGDQGDESEQGDEGDQGDERSKKLIISQKKIIFDTPNAHLEREREKELAKAAKAIEAASEGGSAGVFVKSGREFVASDDVAFFDAEQLTVMQQVSTEDDMTGMMGGVTAFARRRQDAGAVRAKRAYEISELERMMEEAERNGEEVEVGRVLGDGDLLDDFILAATQMDRGDDDDGDDDEAEGEREGDGEGDGDLSEGESWFSDSGSIAGRSVLTQTTDEVEGNASIRDPNSASKKKVPGPGSIASTYWREERQDRKKLLSVIDEQFEQLALEYDEDELGEMDELADDGYIQGGADVEDFESVLDEFIRDHPRREELGGPGAGLRGKLFLAEDMERHGFGNDHAALSIQMAKEAIRKMEAAAAEHEDGEDGEDGDGAAPANAHVEIDRRKFEREDAKWDCESILSLRSNLYNHPGTITEPSSKPPKTIKLGKNGLPVGYGPNGYVSTKTAGLEKIGDDDGSEGDSNDDGDDDEDDMVWSKPSTGPNVRKKGETAEEKKARKAAVKAAKRESRATKKEMKVMFAQERTKASMRESRNPSGLTEIKM